MQCFPNAYIQYITHTFIVLLLNSLLSTVGKAIPFTEGCYCQLGATIFSPWFRWEMPCGLCCTSWFTVSCRVKWRYVAATGSASWLR